MARLIWIGVGAVGGIYAYRKGERVVGAVREQGVAGTAQVLLVSAAQTISAPRTGGAGGSGMPPAQPRLRVGGFVITRAQRSNRMHSAPGAIMDTDVIDITDAGHPRSLRRRKAG